MKRFIFSMDGFGRQVNASLSRHPAPIGIIAGSRECIFTGDGDSSPAQAGTTRFGVIKRLRKMRRNP